MLRGRPKIHIASNMMLLKISPLVMYRKTPTSKILLQVKSKNSNWRKKKWRIGTWKFLNQPRNSTSRTLCALTWLVLKSRILSSWTNTKSSKRSSLTQMIGWLKSSKGAQMIWHCLTMKLWISIITICKSWLHQSKLRCKRLLLTKATTAQPQLIDLATLIFEQKIKSWKDVNDKLPMEQQIAPRSSPLACICHSDSQFDRERATLQQSGTMVESPARVSEWRYLIACRSLQSY